MKKQAPRTAPRMDPTLTVGDRVIVSKVTRATVTKIVGGYVDIRTDDGMSARVEARSCRKVV